MRTRLPRHGGAVLVVLSLMLLLHAFEPRGAGQAQTPVSGQTTTVLPDGRRLMVGGQGPSGGPVPGVAIVDRATGSTTPLPPLRDARAWHTATVLPNGTVLIYGGLVPSGQPTATAEVIDPVAGTVRVSDPLGLAPRARHTATLLTDGRLLVAGGQGPSGPTGVAEVWDGAAGTVAPVPGPLAGDRLNHAALLLPDGSVLISGGTTAAGVARTTAERLDPTSLVVTQEASPPPLPGPAEPPRVEATIPVHEATGIPGETQVALRLSKPIDPTSLQGGTLTLTGPNGPEAVVVVAAEGGRLLFLTPKTTLAPGATYAVTISGAQDTDGLLLAFTSTRFTTAGPAPTAPTVAVREAPRHDHQRPGGDPDAHSHLPKVKPRRGGHG